MPERESPAERRAPPIGLAMVLCDAIAVEPATGKKSILGCFSAILAREFPAFHPTMSVYVALTDGYGKTPCVFRLIDAEELSPPLFQADAEAEFEDPRLVVEVMMKIPGVVFPTPGEYRFQVFANEQFVL